MKTLLPVLLISVLAAGCAVGPHYHRPEVAAPDALRGSDAAAGAASLADQSWWQLLGDEALRSLIEEALREGHDVELAAWRVEEARAQLGVARSELFPQVQGGAGWARGRQSAAVSPFTETADLYDVDLGLSWEIDLWGRIRRLKQAALARYLASEEARRGVLLSLVSDVATGYFRLRALDHQLEIARRTSEAFEGTRTLFRDRLEAGLASSLETSSADAAHASTLASIPDLERRIVEQENQLALLLGRRPGEVRRGDELNDQLLPPEIPAGLPSELLERRPDLRQAERELMAANADVGVAVADHFPRISLTGVFGGVAPEVGDLFGEGKSWSVGGGLLTPVLQGDRLSRQHRAAVARWEQARVRYERSVTNAFVEVSTALVAYRKLAEAEEEQTRAVSAYREAVSLANSRYLSGLADYLEVLQAQQQLFPAETTLARTRLERLVTLVELYRALGGGWQLDDAEWSGPGAKREAD
jgi:multidrug efflux system outer membrane protein